MKRRSTETRSASGNDENFNLKLFESALKNASSRNLILDLLASEDKSVFHFFRTKSHVDVKKVMKRDHCESPTALLRRRELEKINRPDSAQSDHSESSSVSGRSSTLPFEKILRDVVAYVEIKSGGNDRSAGAKALLKSMGATVCEKFSRDVTHVIFKDGSYQTYQRAKLLKVHFVSVLWLEVARRNLIRPPENNYPALGSKNYDHNISLICSQMQKDYEDVIREEIRRTLESGTNLPTTKSLIDNRRRTIASTSKRFENSSEFLNDESSHDIEVQHILQKIRGLSQCEDPKSSSMVLGNVSPIATVNNELCDLSIMIQKKLDKDSSDSFRPSSLNLECHNSDILTSDSECGMVNGDFSRSNNVVDESFDCVTPFGDEGVNSNMEITCSNDSENSETKSLLSSRYISRRKSRKINQITSMELTNLSGKVETVDETPKSVLNNLKENVLNSISYITSKASILKDRDSRKRKPNEKENCIESSANNDENDDDFYILRTPKLSNKRMLKPVILSEESAKNKDKETSKEEMVVNQDSVETAMSSLRVSYSKEDRTSIESEKHSTEMSSLRISSDSKKLSTGTSMSSLKLSKGSIEKSGSTNMSSLRISSENSNSKVASDAQKPNSSSQTRKQEEEKGTPVIASGEKDEEERLRSTPFVTERKKRKYNRKSNLTAIENGDSNHNVNSEVTINDKNTLEKSSENARSKRRVTLALNKEIHKFETELKNRTDFHDKDKEIELHFDEINNINIIKPDVKELTKTPISSGVLLSPFVNTKSRRRPPSKLVEDSNNRNRKSAGIGQGLQLNEVIIAEEQLSDENSEGKGQQPEKAISKKERISDSRKSSENTLTREKKLLSKSTEKKIIKNTSDALDEVVPPSVLGSKRAVVILENIFISPHKDKQIDNKSRRNSRSSTKLKTNTGVVPLPEKSATHKKISEVQDEVSEIKTQPGRRTNFKISRSKSESDIKIEKRRSRRIRKLYNPEGALSNEDDHNEIRVNDTEERDIIRQKKVAKDHCLTQCTSVIGNVLLTQKAMDYLEKNKNNQAELKTLFKSPETVLDQLGIDKKKEIKNKKISILNKSSDEQVELAEEFVHKKLKVASQPTTASRKTQESRKQIRALSQKSQTTNRRNRRSTLEFEPISVPKVKTKLKLNQKPTIVCTKMHRQDVQMFNQIVRKLGTFVVEDEVTFRTTHLVVGEVKRTINMLRALTRGCWILKQEWLLKSLEERKWLPEEEYEATEFSTAVQKCRLERSAFGPSYSMNIFLNCGPVYVAKSTIPRCSDLRELITVCKGKITKTPDNAVICVGAYFEGCKCVNEYWVLDSISAGKLKSLKKYLISKEIAKSPFV